MPIRRSAALAATWLCLHTFAASTQATPLQGNNEPHAIDWYLMSSGGITTSHGGTYALAGSIGQPVAGTSAGGAYTLDAGFWYGVGAGCADCIFSDDFELEDSP
jgi:hypothetical protein